VAGVTEFQFKSACDRELKEIDRRRLRYLGGRPSVGLTGRTAIIVDDGIATGATMRAALQATRKRGPAKLILAVPVAATDTLQDLRKEADEVICLEDHEDFGAIGFFYADFRQVLDDEVISLLKRFPPAASGTGAVRPAA
jgi:predicted phosphoribosyltransferase